MNKKAKIAKRRRIDLRPYFYEALGYIKESRNYIYFIIALFVICALIGFLGASKLGVLDSIIKELVDKTKGLNTWELIVFIFSNNAMSAFLGLFLGLVLGIFSVVNAFLNGTVIGYVFSKVYDAAGIWEFWRILPHGIFELPAIFISLGLGVKAGMFIFSGNIWKEFKRRLWKSVLVYVLVVIPLLVIAAIIEGLLISLFSS